MDGCGLSIEDRSSTSSASSKSCSSAVKPWFLRKFLIASKN
ncbi:MAG: hypothetical protein ACK56F_08150 [bacterium]